jgi:hypothetical protein
MSEARIDVAYVVAAAGSLREFSRAAFERNFLDGKGLGGEALSV